MIFANTGTLKTRVHSLFLLSHSLKCQDILVSTVYPTISCTAAVRVVRNPCRVTYVNVTSARRVSPQRNRCTPRLATTQSLHAASRRNARRGDLRAKPCCKTFHPPCMCIGFRCAPPPTRRYPPSFQALSEFCCKTFPLYRTYHDLTVA